MIKPKFKQTEIGMIPEDWEVKLLEQVAIFKNGRSSPKRENIGKFSVYGSNGIIGFANENNSEENTIIIGRVGAYCGSVYFSKRKCWVTDNAIIGNAKNRNSPQFLFYLMKKLDLNKRRGGSSQPLINQATLNSIKVAFATNESEQSAIAKILSDLDSKIELNQQMNKTLEAIGQAIFKRWFVDFEFPNEKGKPYKSSGGEMVDSELGKIPKGWSIKRIKDCGMVVCGKTPPTKEKENYGEDIFFITIPDMHNKFFVINTERKLSKKGADTQKKKELPPLTVCVSCIATPGLVVLTSEKSQTNQQINSIICNNEISPYFMYLTMKGKAEEIKTRGLGGTATLNLNTGDFENIKIILPNKEILTSFHMLVDETFQKILTNEYQIQNLSQIRDSLLPRLMFGKIRVPVEVKA